MVGASRCECPRAPGGAATSAGWRGEENAHIYDAVVDARGPATVHPAHNVETCPGFSEPRGGEGALSEGRALMREEESAGGAQWKKPPMVLGRERKKCGC